MQIKIISNEKGNPPGKLADVELHFDHAPINTDWNVTLPLAGLKLIGFAVWESRYGNRRNVTFPARAYAVNGERRSFALLRPISDTDSSERIKNLILQAYAEHEEGAEQVSDETRSNGPKTYRGPKEGDFGSRF
jgi:hypothetical protein